MMRLWRKITCFLSITVEVLLQARICGCITPAVACHHSQQKLWMLGLPALHNVPSDVQGRTIIVTGPTRDLRRGDALKATLEQEAAACNTNPTIEVLQLDVASLASVWHFLDEWGRRAAPIHVLINNAGVFHMAGPRLETTDGFESHMGTNHLGPFLLTLGLLPFLQRGGTQARPSRVVNVSSKLQELGQLHVADPHLLCAYSPAVAYGQSKLAQVLFAAEMQRRLASPATHPTTHPNRPTVICMALHPGEVLTSVARSLPAWVQRLQNAIMPLFLLTPEQGARCTVYCATSDAAAEAVVGRHACYFDSNGRAVRPNAAAGDLGLRRWLWAWSEVSVGLPHALKLPP